MLFVPPSIPYMVPEAEAAVIVMITDGPNGGDCSDFGTWDAGTKTCTLTTGISLGDNTAIEIASDGITLDGAGYTMSSNDADQNSGVHVSGKSDIVIKNIILQGFVHGIEIVGGSSNITIESSTMTSNTYGLSCVNSTNLHLSNNVLFGNLNSSTNYSGCTFDTLLTDKKSYNYDETITVSGNSPDMIMVQLKLPGTGQTYSGNIINTSVDTDSAGNYQYQINLSQYAGQIVSAGTGDYLIIILFGSDTLGDIIDTITVHITVPTDATPPDTTPPVISFTTGADFWADTVATEILSGGSLTVQATNSTGQNAYFGVLMDGQNSWLPCSASPEPTYTVNPYYGTYEGAVHIRDDPSNWWHYGATFPIGTTTVTCTGTNDDGNVGTGSLTVNVLPVPVLSYIDTISFENNTVSPGGSTVITVLAYDIQDDPSLGEVRQTLEANVFSDSDPDGIDVVLIETGIDTGVFAGVIYFTLDSSEGSYLQVSVGDTATAEYVDETLPEPYTASDNLTIDATVTVVDASFDPTSPTVGVSNPRFVDAFGNLVDEVGIDQQVQIAADITNTLSVDQEFAYWIEYTGPTSNEMWITGYLTGGQSMSPALSWTPAVPGDYTFTIKLVDSIDDNNSLAAPLILQINIPGPEILIPAWIKNNAGWWADGHISDDSFVGGLQWLITNGIMYIPPTEQGADSDNVIPGWIKNNAGWWADGQIDDRNFVTGLQWLITNGIMIIG